MNGQMAAVICGIPGQLHKFHIYIYKNLVTLAFGSHSIVKPAITRVLHYVPNSAFHPSGVDKWGKGVRIISVRWQVTLCDPI